MMRRRTVDAGSVSVEAVLLAPVLVLLILLVVHVGRLGAAHTRLVAAADHAARAASLVQPRAMNEAARTVALDNMLQNGLACESVVVEVNRVQGIDPVVVQVDLRCVLNRGGLSLLAPVPRVLSATSSEVVDRWRVDS
jgi:uncharacterized membrane protein